MAANAAAVGVSFASGVMIGSHVRKHNPIIPCERSPTFGREPTSVSYGCCQIRVPDALLTHCLEQMPIVHDTPLQFRTINKEATTETFSQRLARFHSLRADDERLHDTDKYHRLLTTGFLQQQKQFYTIPNYSTVIQYLFLPEMVEWSEADTTCMCTLTTGRVTFTFYCPPPTEQLKRTIIDVIQMTLFMIRLAGSSPGETTLQMHIFMNDRPKKFITSEAFPVGSPRYINTGGCVKDGVICMYRSEEIVKVTCHELCHALKIDNYTASDRMSRQLQHLVSIKTGWFNPAESVTETMARVLTCIYLSASDGRASRADGDDMDTLLDTQFRYGMQQASKLLYWNGVRCMQDLSTTPITQTTYAIEYHLFTSALMYSICQDSRLLPIILGRVGGAGTRLPDSDESRADIAAQCIAQCLTPGSGFAQVMDTLLKHMAMTETTTRMTPF